MEVIGRLSGWRALSLNRFLVVRTHALAGGVLHQTRLAGFAAGAFRAAGVSAARPSSRTDVLNRDECDDEHGNENYQSGTHGGGLVDRMR